MTKVVQRVLVVEDAPEVRRLLRLYLENDGFEVAEAEDGEQAIRQMREQGADLILLDILLPGTSGIDVCRSIRRLSAVPIIFVSSMNESRHVIEGLESGADDYITKPFDPPVVIARVKAGLRRAGPSAGADGGRTPGGLWEHGRIRLDLDSYELRVDGRVVELYTKELQLLLFFIHNPNRVFHVEELYNKIWGWDSTGELTTVMVYISNLRKKIEENPAKPQYIRTLRGFGYKFCV
ncbi:response regulator transcription factor [Cohnella cellulosilytica]|uniref:Response regulator transcription factor n=1 Tax=Cohnella cellulosilytica TaxID=986710 RepID=A0ABW2F7H6_9BACL